MSTTHSRTRTRIRAIVVAILVLAFVIPWTYAHIAYAWPWKRFQTGTRITCQDRYLVSGNPHQPSQLLGNLSSGLPVLVRVKGEVVMGTETASLGLSAVDGENFHRLGLVTEIHRGESTTVAGVGTFTLKEAHSGTVWFTPNPGGAAFCFDPDPTFTVYDYAQQGH